MTRSSIREYAEAVRGRYFLSSKKEKGKILHKFTKATGCHPLPGRHIVTMYLVDRPDTTMLGGKE